MVITYNSSIDVYTLTEGSARDFVFSRPVKCFIEPASENIIALYDEAPGGELVRIYMDDLGVEVGDRLSSGTENYFVRGVKRYRSLIGNHSEIIARLGPPQ